MPDDINAADKLAAELTSTMIDVHRLSAGTREDVMAILQLLRTDLALAIQEHDPESAAKIDTRLRRLESLFAETDATIAGNYEMADGKLRADLKPLAALTQDDVVQAMNTVFTINLAKPSLTSGDLQSILKGNVVLGKTLEEHWSKQTLDTQQRFRAEMRKGILAGETNDQIIRRIRGGATGEAIEVSLPNGKTRRVREFAGGIMQVSTREAETLVRTSVQSVSNDVILETYKENQDILRGWAALTTLDSRTIGHLHRQDRRGLGHEGGSASGVHEEGTLSQSAAVASELPYDLDASNEELEQLIEEAGGNKKLGRLMDTVPDSVRASIDGEIPNDVKSFDDWLKIKGDAFAEEKLGAGRFKLWKEGKITTSQLIDQNGRALRIDELKALRSKTTILETAQPAPPVELPPEAAVEVAISGPRSSDEWLTKVNEAIKPSLEKIAFTLESSVPEVIKDMTSKVRTFAQEADVYVRVPRTVLPKILKEGRLKSQFETGTSKGSLNPTGRAIAEKSMWGLPETLPPTERPIYGYVSKGPIYRGTRGNESAYSLQNDSVAQYGDVALRLKGTVKSRATMTLGDSLDTTFSGQLPRFAPAPLNNPNHQVFIADNQPKVEAILKGGDIQRLIGTFDYAEAQIFKGVPISDIEEVVFLNKGPSQALQKQLAAHDLRWKQLLKPGETVVYNPTGIDSFSRWSDERGNFVPERAKLHDEIINGYLAKVKAVDEPVYHTLGGGSAAGKSSVTRSGLAQLPEGHVLVDADDLKRKLPEFEALVKAGDKNAARFVHEESSYLSKRLVRELAEKRSSMVLDGVGDGTLDELRAKLEVVRSRGMKVEATYVTVDTEEAVRRSEKRALDPKSESFGRAVPVDFIRSAHARVSRLVPEALKEGLFDKFALWDNNERTPRLVATYKDKELKIVDEDLWAAFLKKANPLKE